MSQAAGRGVIEKVIAEAAPDEVWFWATHNGAELDLLPCSSHSRVHSRASPLPDRLSDPARRGPGRFGGAGELTRTTD